MMKMMIQRRFLLLVRKMICSLLLVSSYTSISSSITNYLSDWNKPSTYQHILLLQSNSKPIQLMKALVIGLTQCSSDSDRVQLAINSFWFTYGLMIGQVPVYVN